MTRWEYCEVSWSEFPLPTTEAKRVLARIHHGSEEVVTIGDEGAVLHSGLAHVYGRGEARPITKLPEAVAQLGREGWELVSHTFRDHRELGATEILYFKRQLPEPA